MEVKWREDLGGFLSDGSRVGSVLDDFHQLFARLEEGNLLRADYNLLAGPWIAPHTVSALTGGKCAKPADFHSGR